MTEIFICSNCGTKRLNIGKSNMTCNTCGTILNKDSCEIVCVDKNDIPFLTCPLCNKVFTEPTEECDVCMFGHTLMNDVKNLVKMHKEKEAQEAQCIPKCPTCNSANLKKISAGAKAKNTLAFGVFGTKRNKTFHCNNCGYEW